MCAYCNVLNWVCVCGCTWTWTCMCVWDISRERDTKRLVWLKMCVNKTQYYKCICVEQHFLVWCACLQICTTVCTCMNKNTPCQKVHEYRRWRWWPSRRFLRWYLFRSFSAWELFAWTLRFGCTKQCQKNNQDIQMNALHKNRTQSYCLFNSFYKKKKHTMLLAKWNQMPVTNL